MRGVEVSRECCEGRLQGSPGMFKNAPEAQVSNKHRTSQYEQRMLRATEAYALRKVSQLRQSNGWISSPARGLRICLQGKSI